MIFKSIVIILHSYLIITKKLLVRTVKHPPTSADERIGDESYDDYMADAQIQTVNVGDPVDLKCNSPKEFAACFFSKTDEFINYRILPNATFPDKRLQCLCDVSLELKLSKQGSIFVYGAYRKLSRTRLGCFYVTAILS